jgi:hypothetical protein
MTGAMSMDFPSGWSVDVKTTHGRGFTAAEIASQCADKLMYVSKDAPPEIRAQAEAYKLQITTVIEAYIRRAIASDRTTIHNMLVGEGHPALAEAIRRL